MHIAIASNIVELLHTLFIGGSLIDDALDLLLHGGTNEGVRLRVLLGAQSVSDDVELLVRPVRAKEHAVVSLQHKSVRAVDGNKRG